MKSLRPQPIFKDLILVGGGHSHIQVMKMFAMNPIGGLRITLISDSVMAPYSGMLPGFLAGYYNFNQCHFDLPRLCQLYGHRFIHAKVIGIDAERQKLKLEGRPEMSYDFASINVGVEPKALKEEVSEHVIAIKPISDFIAKWKALTTNLTAGSKIAIVGAGAAGVELALVLAQLARRESWNVDLSLFEREDQLVSKHHKTSHHRLLKALKAYGVKVVLGHEFNNPEDFDKVLLSSEAQAPHWFNESGLETDEKGFVKVNAFLKVEKAKNLFAAGDCIQFSLSPLKKAGVYAVRQGKTLSINLRKTILNNNDLKKFKPKKDVLSLITTGHKEAIAHQDHGTFLSLVPPKLLWRLKNWIDLKFMKKFSVRISEMPEPEVFLENEAWHENTCGGCGSKVGASVLSSALKKMGLEALNEDAAEVEISSGKTGLQSIDQFRAFISDPYIFGEISTYHALSDIYAMGGTPTYLMAALSLPPASEKIQREDIVQTMSGILKALKLSGARLAGGHTNEASEFALALSVQGEVSKEKLLLKRNLKVGEQLILTKALGTGVILAAQMELRAEGLVLEKALKQMLISNARALECLKDFEINSCTDVTGFGLACHLSEMLAGQFGARINYSVLPVLDGAQELFDSGLRASISHKNFAALKENLDQEVTDQNHPLFFDPQTSGGLLFSIVPEKAKICVETLRGAGFNCAAIIGEVTSETGKIRLTTD